MADSFCVYYSPVTLKCLDSSVNNRLIYKNTTKIVVKKHLLKFKG